MLFVYIRILEHCGNISKFEYRLKSLKEEPVVGQSQEEGDGENSTSHDTTQVRMAPPDPKSPRLPLSSDYDVTEMPNLLASANTFALSPSAKNDDSYLSEQDEIVELDIKGEEVINNNNSPNLIQEKENGNLVLVG